MRCENLGVCSQGRLVSPSAERNKGPIGEVLARVLPGQGLALEVGSGTGQHVVHFARTMPGLTWQPTERDAPCLQSIAGWLACEAFTNVRPPVYLDVSDVPWPISSAAVVVSVNLLHISPWSVTLALVRSAKTTLLPGGLMFLYGPYRRQGRHTSLGNENFDRQLRAANSAWGVRDLEEVVKLAVAEGLEWRDTYEMPANNLGVLFQKP
jgi:hypothetical protein